MVSNALTAKLDLLLSSLSKLEEPMLWLSGGKDSLLLLRALVSIGTRFHVFRSAHGWSKEQKKAFNEISLQYELRPMTYHPFAGMLFGDGQNLSLGLGFSLGDGRTERMLLVKDIVDGDECGRDLGIDVSPTSRAPIRISVHIVGSKASDVHYSSALSGNGEEVKAGLVTILAPLWNWTDEEVLEALKMFGAAYSFPSEKMDTGNISACTRCLRAAGPVVCPKTGREVPPVIWSAQEQLEVFRRLVGGSRSFNDAGNVGGTV